ANYSPTASYKYNFTKRDFVNVEYRGRTNQPSISQMQPVKNNNNQMRISVGNPFLNPSFEHSLRAMYTKFNPKHLSSFSAGLNGTYTKDALVNNSIYDSTGVQYSQTVNAVNAPINANANVMFNTPLVKNRLQFNTSSEINYMNQSAYSDRNRDKDKKAFDEDSMLRLGDLSKTQNIRIRQNIALTFTTSVIEIGARGALLYSNTQNSLSTKKDLVTKEWTGSGNVNLYLPYNFKISNDLSYTNRQGFSKSEQDELVWNASIEKSMFRKKGTFTLMCYDILRQKLNIRESINGDERQINRFNTLTSYVMLNFTYKISRFGGGARRSDIRPREFPNP
ncbi:MAG: outer membrane beta-barrel protein, partial [Bacteroidales bacterium]|nr:outer membrane beta-barrel protein [Bacteroidales bacterium]